MLYKTSKKNRIGLAIDNSEDISIFKKFFGASHEFIRIKNTQNLDHDLDIIITDIEMLSRHIDDIKLLKKENSPLFLPVVLLVRQKNLASITDDLWDCIDEITTVPAHKRVLQRRVEGLLKSRSQSLELYEANATKNMLFSIVSHDLLSPIVTLSLILKMHKKGKYSGKQMEEYLDTLETHVTNLSDLLNNVLKWAQRQMNRIECNFESFNIVELIKNCIAIYNETAKYKGITIKLQPGGAVLVNADKSIVDIVLRNLLTNAVKFSQGGGTIEISVEKKGDVVEITVDDNGIGMNEEEIRKLLDNKKIFSKKGTDGEKGSGIGFQLCRDLLEICRGKITVKSSAGDGSEFTFTLPAGD